MSKSIHIRVTSQEKNEKIHETLKGSSRVPERKYFFLRNLFEVPYQISWFHTGVHIND
jgi:hypothetical protein